MFNLTQIIDETTRTTERSNAILAHILSNKNDKISQSGVIFVGLSDHCMIFCTRKYVRTLAKKQKC